MILYNRDNIVVRSSIESDVDCLKEHLRLSDCNEVWASGHFTPQEALRGSFESSCVCLTILVENKAIGMFGISPESVLGNRAVIWFLSSDRLDKIKIRFLKNSRKFIEIFLGLYPYLFNYVDDRNEASKEWLKFCKAKIEDPKTHGAEGLPFRYFYFTKD